MKPTSRIQATIEILDSAHAARVPLDKCVGDYMRNRRYIGSKDRREIAERIYNITRATARIQWHLEQMKQDHTTRNRIIIWLAIGEQCDAARIDDLFDDTQYAPNSLTDDETKLTHMLAGQTLEHSDMPEDVMVECPPEYTEALRRYFGDDFQVEMRAMLGSAPLDLRVNHFIKSKEDVIAALDKDGVSVTETQFAPHGLRCKNKAYLSKTKAFNKGWVEIQDEGSQLIAHICDAKPGAQVLDFCAGGGGKTLALAAAMERKGRIVAADNDTRRLENGRSRYKKAGIADIVEIRSLEDERHRKWLKRQKGTFDIVLTDVPCSGTGTWRRNPDMRWRNLGPTLDDILQMQIDILDKAAKAVKPGGRLVYATCSLLPAENEEQIKNFLTRHPLFSVKNIDEKLGLGTPYLRLTPHRHNTDGFFAAILEKQGETT